MTATTRRLAAVALMAALAALAADPAAAHWPTDGAPICTAPSFQNLREVVLDLVNTGGSGPTNLVPLLFVVWEDGRTGTGQDTDIYCQLVNYLDGSPSFEPDGRPVIVAPGFQQEPVAALCGSPSSTQLPFNPCTAGVLIAWRDSRGTSTTLRARKMSLCQTPSWPDTGVPVSPYAPLSGSIGVAGDPNGGGIVAWIDSHTGSQQVYAQRFDVDGNPLWAPGGIPVAAAGSIQDQLAVGPGGGCDAYLAWMEYHPDDMSLRLTLQHLGSDGQPMAGWGPAGRNFGRLSFQEPGSLRPRVLPVEYTGGTIVLWENTGDQSPDGDIAAQRFLADGSIAPGWPAAGRLITAAPGAQYLSAWSESGGGCLAVWSDYRPSGAGIYAQNLTADGAVAPGWDASGQPVYTGSGFPTPSAAVLNDYDGTCYVGWSDSRDGDLAPFVLRLTAAGVPDSRWPSDGLKMCGAPGAQGGPMLVADGYGGAFAAWNDARNNATSGIDLYGQIVNQGATLDAPRPSIPARLWLGPARPNPAHHEITLVLDLPAAGAVRAEVLDVAGRRARAVLDGNLPAGRHTLVWDGRRDDGAEAPSGIYFVRVSTRDGAVLRRVARLR